MASRPETVERPPSASHGHPHRASYDGERLTGLKTRCIRTRIERCSGHPALTWGFGERICVINPSLNPMNHQGISEISFEETYSVPPEQTARALFSRLPHGSDYAQRLIECLATGYLVAVVESICIREMQRHVDAVSEVVVGRTIELEHKGPIPPGSTLKLRGWVERLGERSAKFCVQASDDHELVCNGCVILVVAPRTSMESRIAAKVVALGTKSDGDLAEDMHGGSASLDSLSHLEPQIP